MYASHLLARAHLAQKGDLVQTSRPLLLEPLSRDQFSPFGKVLENNGSARRNFYPEATVSGEGAGELRFWVSHVEPVTGAPLSILQLERHPYAAQTFIPLKIGRWIVIVAPSRSDGFPDVSRLRAFLAAPAQGVSYRRGTWHHGTTVLDAPAQFAVLMWRRAAGDDDELYDLAAPTEIAVTG